MVLLVGGAGLLIMSGAYYAYAAWAGSGVDELNVELVRLEMFPSISVDAPFNADDAFSNTGNEILQHRDDSATGTVSSYGQAPEPVTVQGATLPAYQSRVEQPRAMRVNADLGSGATISPETLDSIGDGPVKETTFAVETSPSWVEESSIEIALYTPVLSDGLDLSDLTPATRIRIPALGLDSLIAELGVVRTNNKVSWETPKHVVGHIPTTANAGSGGHGWYFGHLESPIKGEGSVFRRLPEVPELLKDEPDRPIYVFLEAGARSFAYRIYNVEVVSEEDLYITDSGTQDITLVTCTPRFVYDHRLLVTAALVGVLES